MIISGDKILIFINYSTGKTIKKIETEVMGTCIEIINDSILLMGYFNGNYLKINLKDFTIKLLIENENNYISCMMKLNNSIVVRVHNGIMKRYNLIIYDL